MYRPWIDLSITYNSVQKFTHGHKWTKGLQLSSLESEARLFKGEGNEILGRIYQHKIQMNQRNDTQRPCTHAYWHTFSGVHFGRACWLNFVENKV